MNILGKLLNELKTIWRELNDWHDSLPKYLQNEQYDTTKRR